MKNILTLNPISNRIYDHLGAADYTVANDAADPAGILVRSADMHSYELPASVLAVARAGAGTNNIPCADYAKKGVVVFNTPGANANGVAELVLAAMLLSSRNLLDATAWVSTLKGNGAEVPKMAEKGKKAFVGNEIKGKKLGVIGLGAIGGIVANNACALGMNVSGFDTYLSVDAAWRLSRDVNRAASQDQIFADSDYITLHVPLVDSTRGMINAQSIASMKDGVTILNFSRGELVDVPAMIAALETGKVKRYVTDFACDELIGVKNAILIPHLGASTPESEDNCAEMAAKELDQYLRYGTIVNSVNMPACELPYTGRTRICIFHNNVANVIGQITEIIAADKINISDMINKSKGDVAYTMIDIDCEASDKLLADLGTISDILRIRVI
ncbi:MAG: phosphoglycerate dehydrogenase [Clostridia bacterium]|nr:phosphoglycerate dehydrogenase [Clostridia bacterium]